MHIKQSCYKTCLVDAMNFLSQDATILNIQNIWQHSTKNPFRGDTKSLKHIIAATLWHFEIKFNKLEFY